MVPWFLPPPALTTDRWWGSHKHKSWKMCTDLPTLTMSFRIALNLAVRASDFFFNKLWPFCAPFRRVFITVCALTIKNIFKDTKCHKDITQSVRPKTRKPLLYRPILQSSCANQLAMDWRNSLTKWRHALHYCPRKQLGAALSKAWQSCFGSNWIWKQIGLGHAKCNFPN